MPSSRCGFIWGEMRLELGKCAQWASAESVLQNIRIKYGKMLGFDSAGKLCDEYMYVCLVFHYIAYMK